MIVFADSSIAANRLIMDVLDLPAGKNAEALGENFLLCCCCYGPIPAVGK